MAVHARSRYGEVSAAVVHRRRDFRSSEPLNSNEKAELNELFKAGDAVRNLAGCAVKVLTAVAVPVLKVRLALGVGGHDAILAYSAFAAKAEFKRANIRN